MVNDYPIFIEKVKGKTGIDLSLYKEQQMKRRLTSLSTRYGYSSLEIFYKEMENKPELMDSFLSHMTINVTEFFRNRRQWDILEKQILPEIIAGNQTVKVWSAACSTGEEPYSLAILLAKYKNPASVSILATDLDEVILAKAKEAIYSEQAVKVLAKEEIANFKQNAGGYQVAAKLRQMVKFQKHDLLAGRYPDKLDLIVCRNVMIYFTEEAKAEIIQRFSQSLKKGGILFLGSTESLSNPMQHGLKPIQSFFYQKI